MTTTLVTGVAVGLARVKERRALWPMATLPKLSVAGVTTSRGDTPLPLRVTWRGSVVAEVGTVRVPRRAPEVSGVKVTATWQVAPAARVLPLAGQVPPVA